MASGNGRKLGFGRWALGAVMMLGWAAGAFGQAAPGAASAPLRVGANPLGADAWALPGAPAAPAPRVPLKAGTCVPSPTVLCLDGGRFQVSVTWNQSGGETGVGTVVSGFTADSGLYWFFAPTNYEMMVKVLNGCSVNGRHWVFFLATTNVGFVLTITDTATGASKNYINPAGTVPPVNTDTDAFSTCP